MDTATIDLTTNYVGLKLKNPLVPSSSPLTGNLEDACRLEDAGAAAIVLPSLFEEALIHEQQQMSRFMDMQDIGHHEADSFLPQAHHYASKLDQDLERIERYKKRLQIPVIGSLNGVTEGGWIEHAKDLQEAGCDAIELNLYGINANKAESSDAIERRYLNIVHQLSTSISVPFVVKLSNQFTGLAHFAGRLESVGAAGISLFNRFYQPDIDLDSLQITPHLTLSSSQEALLRIRWLAMLRPQVNMTLAATGGFHHYQDVAKALLAGADVVHLCSVLLKEGGPRLGDILTELLQWMEQKEYESVAQMKGSLSHKNAINPNGYERANYLDVLNSYTPSTGVRV